MNNCVWPKRLYALDVSRGFAALSVVLWHWKHFAFKGNSLPQDFEWASQPLYGVLRLFYEKGAMGVQYFYLLSGFIFFWLYKESIKSKTINFRWFCVQRFSRLYPLHLATLLIVALLQLLYISRAGKFFVYPFNDWYHFVLNLSFASRWGLESGWSFNAPAWSVSIEILLYLIFFLIASFRLGGLTFCLAVSVMSFVLLHLNLVHHAVFQGATLFFLGGAVFQLTSIIIVKHKRMTSLIYLTGISCWAAVIGNYYLIDLSGHIVELGKVGRIFLTVFPVYILFPITVSSLALYEIDKGPLLKPVRWVGDITYSTYLLHFPLQLVFGLALSYGVLRSDFYLNSGYLLFYFLVLIPLSCIVYEKFERPMQNIIRKRYLHLTRA